MRSLQVLYLTGADNAPVREAASTYAIREVGPLLSSAQRVCRNTWKGPRSGRLPGTGAP